MPDRSGRSSSSSAAATGCASRTARADDASWATSTSARPASTVPSADPTIGSSCATSRTEQDGGLGQGAGSGWARAHGPPGRRAGRRAWRATSGAGHVGLGRSVGLGGGRDHLLGLRLLVERGVRVARGLVGTARAASASYAATRAACSASCASYAATCASCSACAASWAWCSASCASYARPRCAACSRELHLVRIVVRLDQDLHDGDVLDRHLARAASSSGDRLQDQPARSDDRLQQRPAPGAVGSRASGSAEADRLQGDRLQERLRATSGSTTRSSGSTTSSTRRTSGTGSPSRPAGSVRTGACRTTKPGTGRAAPGAGRPLVGERPVAAAAAAGAHGRAVPRADEHVVGEPAGADAAAVAAVAVDGGRAQDLLVRRLARGGRRAIAEARSVVMPWARAEALIAASVGVASSTARSWLRDRQDLEDAGAALVAGAAAVGAAAAAHRGGADQVVGAQPEHLQRRGCSGTYGAVQAAQGRRTRRCATTRVSEDATRNGGTPMSTRRVMAETASLVCRVVSTRWPVSEACSASSAVSWSRTSPTRTTSGSWRSTLRRPAAKVRPDFGLTCTCVMPLTCTSTGSSSVTMLRSGVLTSWIAA